MESNNEVIDRFLKQEDNERLIGKDHLTSWESIVLVTSLLNAKSVKHELGINFRTRLVSLNYCVTNCKITCAYSIILELIRSLEGHSRRIYMYNNVEMHTDKEGKIIKVKSSNPNFVDDIALLGWDIEGAKEILKTL